MSTPEPRRSHPIKWILLGIGVGMVLVTVLGLTILIAGPAIFRSLSPEDQDRFIRRIPALAYWQATPAFSAPPTIVSTVNAMALLGTDSPATEVFVATPTTTSTVTATIIVPSTVTPRPSNTTTKTLTNTATATNTVTPTATASPTATNAIAGTVSTMQVGALSTNTPEPTQMASATFTATASPTATATFTTTPTATASFTPSFTPVPPTPLPTLAPTLFPIPATLRLTGIEWVPQTWNNCGPANLVQAMQFLGWKDDQANVARFVRPNKNDKNTSPFELVDYVNTHTKLRAVWRIGGSLDLIKRLAYKRFGVLMETGFFDPDAVQQGWIGHYRTVMGYDDNQGILIEMDSFKQIKMEKYDYLDDLWDDFNRVYVVVYQPEREGILKDILGADWDPMVNANRALATALTAARSNPQDPFAWYNIGSSYVQLGQYQNAALAYDSAFSLGKLPYRITWYEFGPFEAYYRTGQYDKMLPLIQFTMDSAKNNVEEMLYYRGLIKAARGDKNGALDDLNAALSYNPGYQAAIAARNDIQNGTFSAPAIGG